jgi:mRNA-degrading endonuclease RelE of RelBE toxin-antitoxin system
MPGSFNGWRVIYRIDEDTNYLLVLAMLRKNRPETYQRRE